MRILQLHSDYFEYKPVKKEIDGAEEAEKKARRLDDIVVLFVAVEDGDNKAVIAQAVKELSESLHKLKAEKILIYPYAHLSSKLAPPAAALKTLKAMEKQMKHSGVETFRAPFGWNKQFTVSVKGHPLAEQSKTFEPEKAEKIERVSKALKAEERAESSWHILHPNGAMVPFEEFDFKGYENLEKFFSYEISKIRASQQAPPHVKLMKKLEVVDYEPGSDPGNLRWYPKGRLIKSLIEQYVTGVMAEYGAMEVETPVMYDFHHPSLSDYLDRFPARQYVIKSEDKQLFLRFAACFGQFLMLHNTQFSYRQLPLRIYELTRYSFRREKSGEVAGLRRQRAFTMPDCHALCSDSEQAKKEFAVRFKLCMKVLKDLGFGREDYELGIRFTKSYLDENMDFVVSLAKLFAKPVLAEVLPHQHAYWILKWEFNFVDNQDKASALSTDQYDVENARRYDITYVDEKGEKQHPLILHCSPSGGIERCVYALLEKAYRDNQKGKAPTLPLWLSPTQVRMIPVSDSYTEVAEEIAEEIGSHGVRVDLDDRSLTMQRKVRDAEKEWISYILVIGEKEADSKILSVRDRSTGKIVKMQLQKLVEEIFKKTKGKPYKPLPLPKKLSQRPQFFT